MRQIYEAHRAMVKRWNSIISVESLSGQWLLVDNGWINKSRLSKADALEPKTRR